MAVDAPPRPRSSWSTTTTRSPTTSSSSWASWGPSSTSCATTSPRSTSCSSARPTASSSRPARARRTRRASRVEVVRRFPEAGIPTLGVCLGHQSMAQAFGGKVIQHEPVHGKTCEVEHDGKTIFEGLPSPLTVGRYHSLVVDAGDAARRVRGVGRGRRRRHGHPPPRAARRGRPVPPGVRPHRPRQGAAAQLPRCERSARPSPPTSRRCSTSAARGSRPTATVRAARAGSRRTSTAGGRRRDRRRRHVDPRRGGRRAGRARRCSSRRRRSREPVDDPQLGHLLMLFVRQAHWGTPVARTLHAAMLEAAAERGFTELRLFTPAGQRRARRFYEREGWSAVERVLRTPPGLRCR